MSFRKKIMLAFAVSALLLGACDSKKENSSSGGGGGEDSGVTENITYSDEKLLNDDLIRQNGQVIDTSMYRETRVPESWSTSASTSHNRTYASSGLIITELDNKVGFFSLLHNQYLIGERYETAWLQYSVVPGVSGVGFLLMVKYENKLNIYDGFFNNLIEDDNFTYDLPTLVYENRVIEDVFYLAVDYSYSTRYYSYSSSGKATEVGYFPDVPSGGGGDEYDGPEVGTLFHVGWVDLAPFGLNGYSLYVASNGKVTTFQGSTEVVSFNLEVSTGEASLVGNRIMYQKRLPLPDDATEYDYYENGTKYALITRSINILDGAKTDHKYNIVVDNLLPLLDRDGNYTYCAVTYREIVSYRVLDNQVTRIVDKDFVFHDDISTINVQRTVKLPNGNYFDAQNYTLYNSSFQVITNLENCRAYFDPQQEVFVGTVNGKKGLLDMNGVVQCEFDYDSIFVSDGEINGSQRYYLGVRNNALYRIEYGTSYDSYLGDVYSKMGENLFAYKSSSSSSSMVICSSAGTLCYYDSNDYNLYSVVYLTGEVVRYLLPKSNMESYYSYYYTTIKYSDFILTNVDSLPSDYSDHVLGNSPGEAFTFELGDNEYHRNNSGVVYAEFVPEKSGFYCFSSDISYAHYIYRLVNGGYHEPAYSNTSYQSTVHALLYSGSTYYIELTAASSDQMGYTSIEMDDGSNSNYPLYYEADVSGYFTIPALEYSYRTVYVMYTAIESGYHVVEAHASNTNPLESVTKNSTDVTTSGFYVSNGGSAVVGIRFTNYITSAQKIRIYKDDTLTPAGISEDTAVVLEYGQTTSLELARDDSVSYGYFRYDFTHPGTYSFHYTYGTSNTVYFILYDEDGSTLSSNSGSYSDNTRAITGLSGNYLIIQYYLSTYTYTASVDVSASQGAAYENPFTGQFNTDYSANSNSRFQYYALNYDAGDYTLEIKTQNNSPLIFATCTDTGWQVIQNNYTPVTFNVNDIVIMVDAGNATSTQRFSFNLLMGLSDGLVQELVLEESTLLDFTEAEQLFYFYRNNTEETKTVQLQASGSYDVNVEMTYSKVEYNFLPNWVANTRMIVTLAPGDYVYFTVRGEYYMDNTYITLTENVVDPTPYEINLSVDSYAWTESDGVYTSSNKGVHNSTSSMEITFLAAGYFSFEYMSYGESGCDYLIVYINGSASINRQNNSSSTFYSHQMSVAVGDVVKFTFRKDGSVNKNQDCAKIRNLQFTAQ